MQKLYFLHSLHINKQSFQYLFLIFFSVSFFYSFPVFAETTCFANSLTVSLNGNTECLDYQLEYGKIINFEYVSNPSSIIIDVSSDQEGVLSMIIPNVILGLHSTDDSVIIKYDGVESDNFEQIISNTNRNILFFISPGETRLSVMGISPTFDISGSTATIDLRKNSDPTKTRSITIQSSNSFSGTVNLDTMIGDGFKSSITPNSVTLSESNPNVFATLTVTFIGNPTMVSSVDVVGTSGDKTDVLTIPVNGGCLIATATYGSELAPQVQMLREIRDTQLLQTESGTSFMHNFNTFYYIFSPTIAQWERDSPVFKEIVKITIAPLITSLSILNHVDIDSEFEMLVYGTSVILLNIGMYVGIPASVIVGIRKYV